VGIVLTMAARLRSLVRRKRWNSHLIEGRFYGDLWRQNRCWVGSVSLRNRKRESKSSCRSRTASRVPSAELWLGSAPAQRPSHFRRTLKNYPPSGTLSHFGVSSQYFGIDSTDHEFASSNTKVLPIPSSNCFLCATLVLFPQHIRSDLRSASR